MIFTKVNLVGHTCMQKFGVLIQVLKQIDLKIINEFEFKPHSTYNTNQTSAGFHSSFYST
jgi:hypothetical protein